jgi:Tol biopolymer transport system component
MTLRRVALAVLVLAAVAAIAISARRGPGSDRVRIGWVATAHQLGPVGYRDPAGALSPDGRWVAYSEGRFLRVQPAGGGPIVDFPGGEAQIRHIAWHPDSRTILADGFETQPGWAVYDLVARTRGRFWAEHDPLTARAEGGATRTARVNELRQPVWSPDGAYVAAIVNSADGQELWTAPADGSPARVERIAARISYLAWTPAGTVACVGTTDGRPRVWIPCGAAPLKIDPDLDVYGPLAFAPDGKTVYIAFANSSGMLDLWAAPAAGGTAHQLTSFRRDTYAPTVAQNGALLFKVQSYRTVVAVVPAEGGPSQALALFQSETPSWDPSGRQIGITYGTWRRVVDDAHYPDIAQEAGIIPVDPAHPADAPSAIVHASASEDQSLCWSPNGRWLAFHSHKDASDDIWLRPAGGTSPPRRISFLGRGAETGWPRWSPDGRWLLFDGASRSTHRSAMYVIGIDQESGEVTTEAREIAVQGLDAEVSHAEWLPDSARVVVLGDEGPGQRVIFTVDRDGGEARVVHRFASEHGTSGLAVTPDGREVGFIAPAPDGFFQLFRLPLAGGAPIRVTTDPSHKTQPAWSPDGRYIAFTVWDYSAQFWKIE